MLLLKSRKFWMAVAAGVVGGCQQYGLLTEDVGQQIMGVLAVLIAAIALEDHGSKSGTTATAVSAPEAKTVTVTNEQPPKTPIAILAALALLFGTAPAFAADVDLGSGLVRRAVDLTERPAAPPAAAVPLIDLRTIPGHPTIGRQRDPGVSYPHGFVLDGVTLLVTVRELSTDRVYFLDPAYLPEYAALRPWLLPVPYTGVLAGKEAVREYLRSRVRVELAALAGRVVTSAVAGLPAAYRLAGELVAPLVIRDFVRGLLGAR